MAKRFFKNKSPIDIQSLCGWAGVTLAQEQNAILGKHLVKFQIVGADTDQWKGKKRMLWDVTRKVLGQDTPNYPQEIGDCTSFGAKNAMEYLQCSMIILDNQDTKFHYIFPPYFYGCSRVFVGGGKVRGDGSLGIWTAQAAARYGVLAFDEPNVPPYSGSIARLWGANGPDNQFVTIGKKYPVKTIAQITTKEDAADALYHGYPLTVCSNQGFSQNVDRNGFHVPQGEWAHCMSIIGYEDHSQYGLYFIILNSWGDVFGHLKDFSSNATLPVGVLRVRGDVVDSMLKVGDSHAWSGFDGFPGNGEKLDKALFDLVGT